MVRLRSRRGVFRVLCLFTAGQRDSRETYLTGDLKGELVMEPDVTRLPARFETLLAREA